ncbi:hypothetical protein SM033_00183 [Vibrio phage vB_VpaM_sm033]|nr:hypothetical protein SM033_00183 [Vibrio phage vB_VpaM_sm033]
MNYEHYVHQHIIEMIESGKAKGHTLIIDPALYGALNHTIPNHDGDIIFVGFDKISPLEIIERSDTPLKVTGSIWAYECVVAEIQNDMSSVGGLRLIHSDLIPKYRMNYLPFPIYMDEESFEFYRDQRKRGNKNFNNNTVILQDNEKVSKELDALLERALKIDVISYLISTEPTITLKETEAGIQIEGININLSGPQIYDFTGVSNIKGDVVMYNDLAQKFGNVKVEGQIAVVNRY